MTRMAPLDEGLITDKLSESLSDWRYQDNALLRTTTFPTFMRAIAFVNALAEAAEAQDHHPDIDIRYHRVTVRYWTHRAKGVTELDFTGAEACEALIKEYKA